MVSCDQVKIQRVEIKKKQDEGETVTFIEQYVKCVCDFSSQYGSSNSISYTAYNIAGKPSKFPDYGDYPQAFVMRTYGQWWDRAPSRLVDFMPQNNEPFEPSQDYIDIEYHREVFPVRVSIFETYNPGSVVRIWAKDAARNKWHQLWNGPTQLVGHKSRIFSPALEPAMFQTKYLRIEFNHSSLDYYTELDAVLLIGTAQLILPHVGFPKRSLSALLRVLDGTTYCPNDPHNLTPDYLRLNTDLDRLKATLDKHCVLYNQQLPRGSKLISTLALHSYCIPPIEEAFNSLQLFLQRDFPKLINEINNSAAAATITHNNDEIGSNNCGNFSILPDETMLKILKNLDLKSLGRCCRINKHFNNIARDALLYKSLNLKPYWNSIDSTVLQGLAPRCKYLQRLNLSWCGGYSNEITTQCAVDFINSSGSLLTHLRLDSCHFVNDYFLWEVASTCQHLKELCLRSITSITKEGFSALVKLGNLERLELYRTLIETPAMCAILRNNPGIKHLNLAGMHERLNMDEVFHEIANSCCNTLESIDCWKSQTLTPAGIRALTRCTKLAEVDFGWCGGMGAPGDSLRIFLTNVRHLKKVFLAALRGITDRDVEPLLLCHRLEQLDLLGARSLSADICLRFLLCCPCLKMMDLSFCDGITEGKIQEWRQLYPHVSIKRSFQARGESALHP